ncbi:DUF4198 domain-containing protein [Hymenobacter sp. J193]|uniref:DUF4198 domain-containing protein n=1 Tax=Hymenobacter sp. J193 TaxID=2898429 RepID=UPI002151974B|nr:DUF4198 domain-containing protein [Hymenobacter sp. J193]MCR5889158.1 DUF4198 domain-containing protein [Hymenobacter sp. J193]
MPQRLCAFFLLMGLLALASGAGASEFWLHPSRYRVSPGAVVHVRRLVGQQLRGTPWTGTSQRLARLVQYAPNDTVDLTAIATQADTLRTVLELNESGTHVLGLETTETTLTLSGPEFTQYLKAEGLEDILLLREKKHQQDKPARETYHRCAKTLVQVGGTAVGPFSAATGQALELIPDQNPHTAKSGSLLTVRLLEQGRPVRGQLVTAWVKPQTPAAAPAQMQRLYTSPEGRVLVRLPTQPAEILLSSVRMHPHPRPAQADWQSVWTTLTFGVNQPYKR